MKKEESKIKFAKINSITFNDIEYPFAVSVWGLKQIEESTGKDLVEIAGSNLITVTEAKIKFGIMAGLHNLKKSDQIPTITDELVGEMMMSVDGLVGNVIFTYSEAFGKFYNVQATGN